jgi:anti-sigma regulatory factor (Ser/Thr protein kinase)
MSRLDRKHRRTNNSYAGTQPRASLCLRNDDRLVFGRNVNHRDATHFRRLMHRAQAKGVTGFTFDFSVTKFATPVAMAQLVVQTEACRNANMHFDVIEPKDLKMRRIFEHSNWAHHLSPVNYAPNERHHDGWLPVARYRSDEELLRLVNHTCAVVLREADIRRPALHGLEWALNEMADNVLQHAEAPEGGLVAVTVAPQRRKVQFVVADGGMGIPASMRTGHPKLRSDLDAVNLALKQGVTRSRKVGAGNGLAGALRIATAASGSFLVHSGRALVSVGASKPLPIQQINRAVDALDGTVVYFEIAVDRDFDLEDALLRDGIGISDWDYLDTVYRPEENDIRLIVIEEATSTATRIAGRPVRRKAHNLVRAQSGSKVVLDFAGIDRVTASFADEVVGKLLVSLGPDRFSSTVVLDGFSEDLVRGQVARALGQRSEEARRAQERRRRKRRSARERSRSSKHRNEKA